MGHNVQGHGVTAFISYGISVRVLSLFLGFSFPITSVNLVHMTLSEQTHRSNMFLLI